MKKTFDKLIEKTTYRIAPL